MPPGNPRHEVLASRGSGDARLAILDAARLQESLAEARIADRKKVMDG